MPDLSYQLYSSRNFPPLSQTLKMLAEAGYDAVEGYGGLYADDTQLAELAANLDATGLRMPTSHFDIDMLEREPEKVLAIARALGIGTIYCPYLLPDDRPTDAAGWRAFGARLGKVSEPYRAAGLGFGWHNHDFEFVPTAEGALPITEIFEGGPDLEWEADIAWVIRGGADPRAWIETFGPRITAVHVKDIAPAGENADEDGWADVGTGTVDWSTLKAALAASPVKVFVMEHDNPKDDARFARNSLAHVKGL